MGSSRRGAHRPTYPRTSSADRRAADRYDSSRAVAASSSVPSFHSAVRSSSDGFTVRASAKSRVQQKRRSAPSDGSVPSECVSESAIATIASACSALVCLSRVKRARALSAARGTKSVSRFPSTPTSPYESERLCGAPPVPPAPSASAGLACWLPRPDVAASVWRTHSKKPSLRKAASTPSSSPHGRRYDAAVTAGFGTTTTRVSAKRLVRDGRCRGTTAAADAENERRDDRGARWVERSRQRARVSRLSTCTLPRVSATGTAHVRSPPSPAGAPSVSSALDL